MARGPFLLFFAISLPFCANATDFDQSAARQVICDRAMDFINIVVDSIAESPSGLQQLNHGAVLARALADFKSSGFEDVGLNIIRRLGEMPGELGHGILLGLLHSENPQVRGAAADAIAKRPDKDIYDLTLLLTMPRETDRDALGKFEKAAKLLMTGDLSPYARQSLSGQIIWNFHDAFASWTHDFDPKWSSQPRDTDAQVPELRFQAMDRLLYWTFLKYPDEARAVWDKLSDNEFKDHMWKIRGMKSYRSLSLTFIDLFLYELEIEPQPLHETLSLLFTDNLGRSVPDLPTAHAILDNIVVLLRARANLFVLGQRQSTDALIDELVKLDLSDKKWKPFIEAGPIWGFSNGLQELAPSFDNAPRTEYDHLLNRVLPWIREEFETSNDRQKLIAAFALAHSYIADKADILLKLLDRSPEALKRAMARETVRNIPVEETIRILAKTELGLTDRTLLSDMLIDSYNGPNVRGDDVDKSVKVILNLALSEDGTGSLSRTLLKSIVNKSLPRRGPSTKVRSALHEAVWRDQENKKLQTAYLIAQDPEFKETLRGVMELTYVDIPHGP